MKPRGSVASSLAWSAGSLIGFRVLQGVGGGLLLPLMSTLVVQAAGGRALGRLMAVVSLPAILGPILGPVIGGLILNSLDWRWLFWVNVPFCVAGLLLAWRLLPPDPPTTRRRLDVPGFVLLAGGVASTLFGLSRISGAGSFLRWSAAGPTLLGVGLLVGFVIWALLRGDDAIVDVRLLAHRPVRRRPRCCSCPGPRCTERWCCCRCTSRKSVARTRFGRASCLPRKGWARS